MSFAYALGHYFLPQHSNNHKAKILHTTSLLLLSLFFIGYQLFLYFFQTANIGILGYAANIPPDEIIRLTNQKRAEVGQPALQFSSVLASAAKAKGEHMLSLDYWAHVAPDGTEPWKFFADAGYRYKYAGENLARDFSNPADAITAWIASPSHKENMLSSKYREIGVAVVEGDLSGVDTTIIVQLFGTRLGDTTEQVPAIAAKPVATGIPTIAVTKAPVMTVIPTIVLTSAPVAVVLTPVPTRNEEILLSTEPAADQTSRFRLLISPFQTTRGISLIVTFVLLMVMVIDGILITKRKIPRLGGRTFAHIAFLAMILAVVLIARAGKIL